MGHLRIEVQRPRMGSQAQGREMDRWDQGSLHRPEEVASGL